MITRSGVRTIASIASEFKIREAGEEAYIEGYFSVFNTDYVIASNFRESVAPGAFAETLGEDIRCLVNHDTTLVLGRNKAGTLELREDSHGLWGRVKINPNDQDAVNLYERVKRGDVNQCSFGFEILDEETEIDGENYHWIIRKVKLYEVSVCTFPAYEDTEVKIARTAQIEEAARRALQVRKDELKKKLKENLHGIKKTDA